MASDLSTLTPPGVLTSTRAPLPPPVPQVLSARLRAALRRDRLASGEHVPPNVRLPSRPTEGKPLPPPPPVVARASSDRRSRRTAADAW